MRTPRLLAATAATGLLSVTALVAATMPAQAAQPASRGNTFSAALAELNGSGVTGTAQVKVRGSSLDVAYRATGLLAGMPHAVHLHYSEEAQNECPTPALDTDGDGKLSTVEGLPAYGDVVVSLTTSGDTSPESILAVDRYPTAPGGTIDYARTVTTSRDTALDVKDGEVVLVIHGLDYAGGTEGAYDLEAGESELAAGLPREATDPSACGVLR